MSDKLKDPLPELKEWHGEIIGFCFKACPFYNRHEYPESIRCDLTEDYNTGKYLIVCIPWLRGVLQRARITNHVLEKKNRGDRWVVYILKSEATPKTYTGCTVDAKRRLRQHNGEIKGGAKSTRAGRPWKLAQIIGPFSSQSEAQIVEHQVKMRKEDKDYGPLDCS